MTELHRALVDIRSIRRQVAQSTEFRGYGPLTLFATAAIAVLAGAIQASWFPQPGAQPTSYVALWLGTGVLCAALIATQMLARANRLHSAMADDMVWLAVTQFLPAGIAGVLLPLVLLHAQPAAVWMMPGLWQILFSLGVFASCRSLPRPMLAVGAWFLCTGFACLLPGDSRALAPAAMTVPYAIGMSLVGFTHVHCARKDPDDEEL